MIDVVIDEPSAGRAVQPGQRSVLATIPEWWARRAYQAGLRGEWLDWRRALPPPPMPLNATPLPGFADADPAEFGQAYIELSDAAVRSRDGRHFTPAALADCLWEEAVRAGGGSEGLVVDPACGAGALLLPALRSYLQKNRNDPLREVAAHIKGTDTDADAVWLGNAMLGAELLPWWAKLPEGERSHLPRLLSVSDGLEATRDDPAVLVMNPPYGRVRLSSAERERWQRSLYGHSNRYALFLHAAIERLAEGGVLAAVVPASFLAGNYYQNLRALIAELAPLHRLVFVDERSGVFAGGVLQETCLATFRKGGKVRTITTSRVQGNGTAHRVWTAQGPKPRPPYELPWWLPRTTADARLVTRAAGLTRRLPDYGWKASTGPLVWNRHKPQISAKPCKGMLPILWAADIDGGRVQQDPARDHQRWFRVRDQDRHMLLTQPAVLVQRTTASEQPRRLVAATLSTEVLEQWGGGVIVENHVNVLRASRPSELTPELLKQLLDSDVFDRLYRSLSGSVAVSAYELESIPLPPPHVLRGWQQLSSTRLDEEVWAFYA